MSDSIGYLAVGFVLGIITDGLMFDWPFRKRKSPRAARKATERRSE